MEPRTTESVAHARCVDHSIRTMPWPDLVPDGASAAAMGVGT